MKLRPLGTNQNELEIDEFTTVLFSYQTPVAAIIKCKAYRTAEHWSTTTSKHINKWLGHSLCKDVEEKPQSFFDDLCKGKQ